MRSDLKSMFKGLFQRVFVCFLGGIIVFTLPTTAAVAMPSPPALSITTVTLSKLLTGVSDYYCAVSATDGADPYAWSASGLPAGLSIAAIDGTNSTKIYGTPAAAGSYTLTITATDSLGASVSKDLTLTVETPVHGPYTVTPTTSASTSTQAIASATIGTAYSTRIGPGLIADQVPPGLSYDISSGMLSGTPTAAGGYHIGTRVTSTVNTSLLTIVVGEFFIGYNFIPNTNINTNSISMTVNDAVFTVRFNSQGGSEVADIGGVHYGGKLSKPAAPARMGYAFSGWYKEAACINAWNFDTDVVMADTTLYAGWVQNASVTISCQASDVALYGASTGAIAITAGGGGGTYEYSIDNGATWQSSGDFTGLPAGTYTAAVRDKANPTDCISASVSVKQPRLAWKGMANKMPSKANAGTAWVIKPASAPKGYTLKSTSYQSGSRAIATIDNAGNATFLKGGKVKLTVIVQYQKGKSVKTVKSIKSITVNQLVQSITLNKTSVTMKSKSKLKLISIANPSSASNRQVVWKSSNTKVAAVSSAGVVTTKGKGTAVITCTAKDGSKARATCTILVK